MYVCMYVYATIDTSIFIVEITKKYTKYIYYVCVGVCVYNYTMSQFSFSMHGTKTLIKFFIIVKMHL